jgi:nitrogenase molybdenum-iron protein beta chain
MSNFLDNELGFIVKGVYITDNIPEKYKPLVIEAAASRDETFRDKISFEIDGGIIQEDIIKKLGKSTKALLLGSGWEKILAIKTKNLYTFISLPLPETVILNKSFLGYDGALALAEEIYSNVFKTKRSYSNLTVSAEVGGGWDKKEKAHAL